MTWFSDLVTDVESTGTTAMSTTTNSTGSGNMNVLYVTRHPKTRHRSFWMRQLYNIRDSYFIDNRSGYFLASLRTCASLEEVDIDKLRTMSARSLKSFDVIIFHHLCSYTTLRPGFEVLDHAIRELTPKLPDVPRVLLLATADAFDMPPDETLDLFDLVFKREPLKDMHRYELSERNRGKIHPTVLSCHLVPATIFNYKKIRAADYGEKEQSVARQKFDVFFAGMDTSNHRRDLVKLLNQSDLQFVGGIQKEQKPVPGDLVFDRLSKRDFYETIGSSKINLAIEGYGQFTYRHWELWCLSAFMISSPSIREIRLPFEFAEGVHYVAYDDFDDLMDKIRFYLENPEKRGQIARNGRELFEREYDFRKHGRQIARALTEII